MPPPSVIRSVPTLSVLTHRTRKADAPLRLLGFDVQVFHGYVNRRFTPHRLDVALLSFVVRGTGRHVIGDETFERLAPSLGIISYGQHHDIVTTGRGADVINVYLDLKNHPPPVLPAPLHRTLPDLFPLHPNFAHHRNRSVLLPLDDPEPYLGLLLNLDRELHERPSGYEMTARNLLQICLTYCCRQALAKGLHPLAPEAVHPAAGRIDAVRHYLAEHYAEPQSLAGLAARAGVSRAYLCRAFRMCTGKPLFDYLLERRLQAAMIELRTSDRKVLSVALDCGFQDLSYFNRTFRRLVGSTPTAYRRSG